MYTRLTEALGLPPDADAETTVAAVEDLVTTPPNPAQVAAAAGLTTLDPDTLTQLRADAERGRTLAAAATKRHTVDVVRAAIAAGKLAPARRTHWEQLLHADPGMETTLAAMPDGLIPVDGERGHALEGPDDVIERATWFHA